jgi:FkbM family methyltransferase
MKYSVIIPTYNHCNDLLKPCVESIFKYTDVTDVELIISANGCKDETLAYVTELQSHYSLLGISENLKVVWNNEALGYSRACNAGIEVATTDLIVLLNNDTVLLPQEKNRWLTQLASVFQGNEKAGISCLIKSESEPAGHEFAIFFCVMIHRRVFDKIGLLSLDYGAGGGEDTEFSIECERAGFQVLECVTKTWNSQVGMYCGDFPIYHLGEGTVHDKNLVPEWDSIFIANSKTLARKYNVNWLIQNGFTEMDITYLKKQHEGFYKEIVEENYYEFSTQSVSNRVVIDIGANVGIASVYAASLGAKKVISVEPTKVTYDKLVNNISLSGYSNIIALQKAVSNVTGNVVKISHNQNDGANGMHNIDTDYEEVETVSLNDLLKMTDGCEVILKLDCEGAEFDILMNASSEDLKMVSTIALEVHSKLHPIYKDRQHIEDKLRSLGFSATNIQPMQYWQFDSEGRVTQQSELPFSRQRWVKSVNTQEINLDFLKEQDPAMHREVIEANQYHLTPERVKDRIVIDIGANIGAFSLYAAALGAKKVISVEPISASYNTFLKNIHRLGLPNITTYKKIVSEKSNDFLPVSLNDNAGANSMYNVSENYEVVETITFSEIMNQIAGHDIILKLDCEGGEYDVIMNANEHDMVRINEIMMEIHTDLHPKYKGKEVIEQKLIDFGFEKKDSVQIYYWDWDQNGQPVNYREAPFVNQYWKK